MFLEETYPKRKAVGVSGGNICVGGLPELLIPYLLRTTKRSVARDGFLCYSLATMVVRMRHTRSHTKNRRSHHALKEVQLSTCSHCGELHRPHHMCLNCGYYNGRQVLDLETEKIKRDARIKAKEERIKGEAAAAAPAQPDVKDQGATGEVANEKPETDTGTEVAKEKIVKRK